MACYMDQSTGILEHWVKAPISEQKLAQNFRFWSLRLAVTPESRVCSLDGEMWTIWEWWLTGYFLASCTASCGQRVPQMVFFCQSTWDVLRWALQLAMNMPTANRKSHVSSFGRRLKPRTSTLFVGPDGHVGGTWTRHSELHVPHRLFGVFVRGL